MGIKCASLCKAGRSGHPPLPTRALLGVTTENSSRDLKGLTRAGGRGGFLPRPALPLNFWETAPLLQAVYCPLLEVLGAVRFSKVGALGMDFLVGGAQSFLEGRRDDQNRNLP